MSVTVPSLDNLSLNLTQEVHVRASLSATFDALLQEMGPANVTPERTRTLRAFGAELVLTDPMEGTDGSIREARRLFAGDPQRYYYADQYNNDANWRAHYETTATARRSRTSSPASAPAVHSWGSAGGCASSTATSA